MLLNCDLGSSFDSLSFKIRISNIKSTKPPALILIFCYDNSLFHKSSPANRLRFQRQSLDSDVRNSHWGLPIMVSARQKVITQCTFTGSTHAGLSPNWTHPRNLSLTIAMCSVLLINDMKQKKKNSRTAKINNVYCWRNIFCIMMQL